MQPPFVAEKHVAFIQSLDNKKEELEYWLTEHLRLSGIYWGLTCLDLLGRRDALEQEKVIRFVLSCQHSEKGGFGGYPGHDPHLLYTLSALQILATYDALDRIQFDPVLQYVKSLAQPDGSFAGDEWGEVDTRFSFCALASFWLLGALNGRDPEMEDLVHRSVAFLETCQNFDGGFGSIPSAESHAGQIFCCVGALAIVDRLDVVDADLLGWWLCERQLPCGGLNGRPEKLEDVCYSWWVLSSLQILERLHWIDAGKLQSFILSCQDQETGGISDRPGDMVDVFHTLFGVAGLSLLAEVSPDVVTALDYPLRRVNPIFCLAEDVVQRLRARYQYKPAK